MLLRVFVPALLLCPFVCGAQQAGHTAGGAYPSREDVLSIPFEYPFVAPKGEVVPDRVDLSSWFPPAGDQYAQASCSGWALGYALATYQWNKLRDRPSDTTFLSDPANVFSPAFVYNLTAIKEKNDICTLGVQLPDAVRLVCDTGCATWLQYPFDTATYNCIRPVPDSAMIGARRHRMSHPVSIGNRAWAQWKHYLSRGQPVIFFVTIGPFFEQGFLTMGDSTFVWDEPFPTTGFGPPRKGHIMICTGYEDDTFIALNSWGRRWGDHGYVRIPDSTMWWACSDAYVLRRDAAPMLSLVPAKTDHNALGKDGTVKDVLKPGALDIVDSIGFRLLDVTTDGRFKEVEFLDVATKTRIHTLAVSEDQPITFHFQGHLYTFTYTGRNWLTGATRYVLAKDAIAQTQALQEQLKTIDLQSDGVINGH